ncbi:unnamed protein product [Calypogeia fissa]
MSTHGTQVVYRYNTYITELLQKGTLGRRIQYRLDHRQRHLRFKGIKERKNPTLESNKRRTPSSTAEEKTVHVRRPSTTLHYDWTGLDLTGGEKPMYVVVVKCVTLRNMGREMGPD